MNDEQVSNDDISFTLDTSRFATGIFTSQNHIACRHVRQYL